MWPVGDGLWAAAAVVMLLASILLMGSIVRNPALPNPGTANREYRPEHAAFTPSPGIQ